MSTDNKKAPTSPTTDLTKLDLSKYGFQHISKSYDDALYVIDGYRTGKIKPLKTPYLRFNKLLGGGLHKSTIYTIGGRPGTGKSALCNRIIFGICDLAEEPVLVIYWNFEMPNYQQVIRELGAKHGHSVNDLKSAENRLALDNYNKLKDLKELFYDYPIYLNSKSKTPEQIKYTVNQIREENPKTHIVNVIDHSRLITAKNRSTEEERITKLYSISRDLSVEKGVTSIILSQLNRNIESEKRMMSIGPIPQGGDYFGSDAVQQTSNVAFIIQRPEMYNGLNSYLGFDISKLKDILFVHFTKNRDGEVKWVAFKHNLAHNQLEETKLT